VLGHEGAGVVEEMGRAVKGVRPGQHVVLSYQSCGQCPECKEGRPAHCRRFWELNFGFARGDGSNALAASGVPSGQKPEGVRGHFFGQSSLATHALATERNLVKVDGALPLDLLAPLGCGLQTGAGTVLNSLAVKPGASLAVFGTGSVGLAAVMAARIAGARPIIAVDRIPKRLALARALGATHCVDNRKADVARRVRAITGGGVDHVLDNTGDAGLYEVGIDLLKPGGSMALLAGGGGRGELPDGRRVFGVIQGDAVPQRFIPYLIELYREGRFPFDRLIKHFNFGDINRAIAEAKAGRVIKPVLRMGEAG
jgi:aryl-alcohol dehydrogenase